MAIPVPAVGDKVTAVYGDGVANALNNQLLGSAASVGSVTLSTVATNFAGGASVTFTLTVQTRVVIRTLARYALGTATGGRMTLIPGYNTGNSVVIGSVTQLTDGQYHISNFSATAGANGSNSGTTEADTLLAAGTYTAYAVVNRASGGSATDVAAVFRTAVFGVGFN